MNRVRCCFQAKSPPHFFTSCLSFFTDLLSMAVLINILSLQQGFLLSQWMGNHMVPVNTDASLRWQAKPPELHLQVMYQTPLFLYTFSLFCVHSFFFSFPASPTPLPPQFSPHLLSELFCCIFLRLKLLPETFDKAKYRDITFPHWRVEFGRLAKFCLF